MQREERIRRNRDMLQQLGVQQAAPCAARRAGPGPSPGPGECAAPKRRAVPPEALEPTRRSARARGAEPGACTGEEERGAAVSAGARGGYDEGWHFFYCMAVAQHAPAYDAMVHPVCALPGRLSVNDYAPALEPV